MLLNESKVRQRKSVNNKDILPLYFDITLCNSNL